jgi:hypothetical protein
MFNDPAPGMIPPRAWPPPRDPPPQTAQTAPSANRANGRLIKKYVEVTAAVEVDEADDGHGMCDEHSKAATDSQVLGPEKTLLVAEVVEIDEDDPWRLGMAVT